MTNAIILYAGMDVDSEKIAMIIDWPAMELFVGLGPTDMRKQINGLAVLVESDMKKRLFGKSLFLFCNREKRILKVLYWDRTGFWLMQKRLEKDRFPWPTSSEQAARKVRMRPVDLCR